MVETNQSTSILDRNSVHIIQELLDAGFCLVPSNIWNKDEKPKVPWWDWKKITKPLSGVHLLDAIKDSKADSIAVVSGIISGGGVKSLVIVDIDTKYKKGIDATIFSDLEMSYPDLKEKMRIERTPSGGYHLYYFVLGEEEPLKFGEIASRIATEKELTLKPKTPRYGFIEIKNIAQCYPSPGYKLIKDNIGNLSWAEHCSITQLLRDYSEIEPEANKDWNKAAGKGVDDLYEISPWKSFDLGKDRDVVLEKYGEWRFKRKVGGTKYYIKPDKPTNYREDSAVYRESNNRYKVYTTSSELSGSSYSPVNALLWIKFNGDRVACFAWLVSEGYGVIKEYREKRLIKKALSNGGELPANISEKALKEFEEEKGRLNEKYPYDIFWEEDFDIKLGESKFNISREKVYSISEKLGFYIKGEDICFISGDYVEVVEKGEYFDVLKKYIADAGIEVIDCFEAFLQKSGDFTITRLRKFNEDLILKSDKYVSYKFYKNGFIEVTLDKVEFKEYSELNGKLVWKHDVQQRDYIKCAGDDWKLSKYYDFINKAIFNGYTLYLKSAIGYYAHDYKATTTPYIVILCETCENPAMGAGSGKNIFTNLLNFTSSVLNKPARNVKFDDTMLRIRKQQKIISLNDAEKKFDYMGLRELSSGDGEVGKKYKQEQTILAKDMPKFIVNTNFSFDPSLPGLKRRLIPIEFTEFFTRKGGVDIHYGIDFPTDSNSSHGWTEIDWIGYDHIVLECIQEFIRKGCKLTLQGLSDGGWVKQFCQRFGNSTFDFIKEYISEWTEMVEVPINIVFNKQKEDFYKENSIGVNYQIGSIKMNEALNEYCLMHGIKFCASKNTGRDVTGKQINAKVFEKIGVVPVLNEEIEEELPF